MDRRVMLLLVLLPVLTSAGINLDGQGLRCSNDDFSISASELSDPATSGTYNCKCPESSQDCSEETVLVKVRTADSVIELDVPALVSILVSDIAVTALIGWAVYSICSQPRARSSYQGNKASDKVNLINNSAGGDTYQPLNTRTDEYSTLHAPRKHKNAKHAMSP